MAIKVNVNNVAKEATDFKINVNNVAKQVSQIYCNVGGTANLVWENWKYYENMHFAYVEHKAVGGANYGYSTDDTTTLTKPIRIKTIHVDTTVPMRDFPDFGRTAKVMIYGKLNNGSWEEIGVFEKRASDNGYCYFNDDIESNDQSTLFYGIKASVSARTYDSNINAYAKNIWYKGSLPLNLRTNKTGRIFIDNLQTQNVSKIEVRFKMFNIQDFATQNGLIAKFNNSTTDVWNNTISVRNAIEGQNWIGYSSDGSHLNVTNTTPLRNDFWYTMTIESNKIKVNTETVNGTAPLLPLTNYLQIGGQIGPYLVPIDLEIEYFKVYNGEELLIDLSSFKSATEIVNKGSLSGIFTGTNCGLVLRTE